MNHRSRKHRYPPMLRKLYIKSYTPFVQGIFTKAWSDRSFWPKWLQSFTTVIVPDQISEHVEARFIMTEDYNSHEITITLRPFMMTKTEQEECLGTGIGFVDNLKTDFDPQSVRQRTYQSIQALFAKTKPEWTELENI